MFISRSHIKQNPHTLFLFGDNDLRRGMGGMAREFRGEPNALGIRTKKAPRRDPAAYYTDREYVQNIKKIGEDISRVILAMDHYTYIWAPTSLGTGLANMQEHSPKTLQYLQGELDKLRATFGP